MHFYVILSENESYEKLRFDSSYLVYSTIFSSFYSCSVRKINLLILDKLDEFSMKDNLRLCCGLVDISDTNELFGDGDDLGESALEMIILFFYNGDFYGTIIDVSMVYTSISLNTFGLEFYHVYVDISVVWVNFLIIFKVLLLSKLSVFLISLSLPIVKMLI